MSSFRRSCLLVFVVVATLFAGGVGTASAAEDTTVPPAGVGPYVAQPGAAAPVSQQSVAASPCWYSESHWWCENRVPTPIYAPGVLTVIDYVWTNPSWFVCRSDDGGHVGGPHPNRWEWTQGDVYGRWGWVKDTDIASETNPLPVC